MDSLPPDGPEGREPFPTFDPSFTPPEQRRRPQRPAAPRPATGRSPAGGPRRGTTTQASPVLVGLAVGLVLTTISAIAFFMLSGGDTVAITTTTTSATTTSVADGSSSTTVADGSSSTTVADGSSSTTVTIIDGTGNTTVTPIGDAIPIADLTMSANDIGPLNFGDAANTVLGRLAATFGPPTDDTGFIVGNGSFGECPGDSIRVVQWGPLKIVVKGEAANATFVSYRLDLRYGGVTAATTDLATLSGLRVGNTVGTLKSIYAGYVIEYVVDQEVGLTFELRSSQNDALPLLWGPIDSQADDSTVTGIYSPDSCDQQTTSTTTG